MLVFLRYIWADRGENLLNSSTSWSKEDAAYFWAFLLLIAFIFTLYRYFTLPVPFKFSGLKRISDRSNDTQQDAHENFERDLVAKTKVYKGFFSFDKMLTEEQSKNLPGILMEPSNRSWAGNDPKD